MDASERAEVIERFNDPKSDVQVLVTSLKVSTFGLNLQGCCSDLIVVGVADNVNAMMQVIGRIHRLGQTREQRVWVLTLARSYDNILQHNQTTKMLQQVAGEANLELQVSQRQAESFDASEYQDTRILGRSIRMACQSLVQQLLGQRHSRAPKYWRDLLDLEKPLRVQQGLEIDDGSSLSPPPRSPRRRPSASPESSSSRSPGSSSSRSPESSPTRHERIRKRVHRKIKGQTTRKARVEKAKAEKALADASGSAADPAVTSTAGPPRQPSATGSGSTAKKPKGQGGSKRKRSETGDEPAPLSRRSARAKKTPATSVIPDQQETWYEQAPNS